MAEASSAPTPGFAPAFRMTPMRAFPVTVGEIATGGQRSYVSIGGGTFVGEGLEGRLVGGSEMHLLRADGVTVVEASYYVAFSDGSFARCFGNGYRTRAPDFEGLRLALLFEAAEDGGVAHLARLAFVAEQAEGSPVLNIERIV
ncbi:hypothetical protein M2333_001851 [Sphingobium sp. B11D3B]|uniref:DUF3237 domain-containing protein n=1 Tax=Sphingobium sp. B11D3B TaxID=2940575 RepID=UPI002225C2CE|nr:DUF3237 domain-containing protein [Sphingobium sp. B11D3B]MCW2388805.1 hypothetical protein [Sphingobium sp. B11D3B]